MGKDIEKNRNNSLMILEGLMVFDLWLLMKTRWLLKKTIQLLTPILKILLSMALGAVLLLAYILAQAKFDIVNHQSKEFACKNTNPLVGKYLEINDYSKSDATSLKKELIKIKSETMNLQKSLHRLNLHFRTLYDRQRNMDMNLADFASEIIGGIVIDTPDTQSYYKPKSLQMTLFGIPIWKPNYYTPRKVIQPWSQPGECWAFCGSQGKIEIELAHTAIIDRVTLEHIPASASLTGNIDSAPKSFNVLGKVENQYVIIDTFKYKDKGLPSQIFEIKKQGMKNIPFKRVILEILSNWGNPDYTCIYRFKVHGKMYLSKGQTDMKVQ